MRLSILLTSRYVDAYAVAVVSITLGELDRTFTWLEKAFEEFATWLTIFVKCDPRFDPLARANPRFQGLLQPGCVSISEGGDARPPDSLWPGTGFISQEREARWTCPEQNRGQRKCEASPIVGTNANARRAEPVLRSDMSTSTRRP